MGFIGDKCLPLTHWGRVTHICVSKLTIIGSDNGLSPGRRQAIIWTNAGLLLIGPLGTNFSEILIGISTFSFKKMSLKMLSGNWQTSCLGLNVLWICKETGNESITMTCSVPYGHHKISKHFPVCISVVAWSRMLYYHPAYILYIPNICCHVYIIYRAHFRKYMYVTWPKGPSAVADVYSINVGMNIPRIDVVCLLKS